MVIDVPERLYGTQPLEKINSTQIEKGLVRLKFKHPLSETPIYQVLGFLKPFRKLCCRKQSDAVNPEADSTLKRNNTFKQLQKAAKKGRNRNLTTLMSEVAAKNGVGSAIAALDLDLAEKINEVDFSEQESDDDDLLEMYNDMLDEDNDEVFNNFKRSKTQLIKE